jgi:hypothetical protein
MLLSDLGQHHNLEGIPSFRQFLLDFTSDVPSIGEGNSNSSIGYVSKANYSPLVVDYHEEQLLDQLNIENQEKLQNKKDNSSIADDLSSITVLPSLPNNSLAFDGYAYCFNNPVRYDDPSGHCPACAVALTAIGPIGWVVLGVIVVGTVVYFAVGGPEKFAKAFAPAADSLSNQAANGIKVLQTKEDWIPPGLTKEERDRWGKAAELYKEGIEQPKSFQLPKDLAKELAELIKQGKTAEEAADELGELEDSNQNH